MADCCISLVFLVFYACRCSLRAFSQNVLHGGFLCLLFAFAVDLQFQVAVSLICIQQCYLQAFLCSTLFSVHYLLPAWTCRMPLFGAFNPLLTCEMVFGASGCPSIIPMKPSNAEA